MPIWLHVAPRMERVTFLNRTEHNTIQKWYYISLWHWPNWLLARMGILFGLVNIKMYRDFHQPIFIFTSWGGIRLVPNVTDWHHNSEMVLHSFFFYGDHSENITGRMEVLGVGVEQPDFAISWKSSQNSIAFIFSKHAKGPFRKHNWEGGGFFLGGGRRSKILPLVGGGVSRFC